MEAPRYPPRRPIIHLLSACPISLKYCNVSLRDASTPSDPLVVNQTELPGFGDYVFNRGHNALLQYVKTLSPRTINSVSLGFNRAVRQIFAQNYQTNVNALWGVNYLPTVLRDYGVPVPRGIDRAVTLDEARAFFASVAERLGISPVAEDKVEVHS